MIAIALGSNLNSRQFGGSRCILEAALSRLCDEGVTVLRRSHWYASAPVPQSDMPWFVNGVATVSTALPPGPLMTTLHRLETAMGRTRKQRWEARIVDLDLLCYDDTVSAQWPDAPDLAALAEPILPHPRLHERAFVLRPLAEVAPAWRHPVLHRTATDLLHALGPGQRTVRL